MAQLRLFRLEPQLGFGASKPCVVKPMSPKHGLTPCLHLAGSELAVVRSVTIAVALGVIAQEPFHADVFAAGEHARFELLDPAFLFAIAACATAFSWVDFAEEPFHFGSSPRLSFILAAELHKNK